MTYENPESVSEVVQIYGPETEIAITIDGYTFPATPLGKYAVGGCPLGHDKNADESKNVRYVLGKIAQAGQLKDVHQHIVQGN